MKKIAIVALLSTLVAAPALAESTGKFYVGANYGSASFSNATVTINGTPNTFANPGALSIAGGYHFSPHLAVEVGYTTFGDSTLVGTSGNVTLATKAVTVAAVGTYPLNSQFDLFGKLGMSSNSWTESLTGNLTFTGGGTSASGSQSDVLVGVGAQYHATEKVGLRAQYENFGKFSSGATPLSASVFSLGLTYDF